MFSMYAAIVKNLRGVIAFEVNDREFIKGIEWLSKRFKYRNIGIGPRLAKKAGKSVEGFIGKPLRVLTYPVKDIEALIELLIDRANMDPILIEALVLSSTYVSPLMIISEKYVELIDKIAVHKVKVRGSLDISSWKLHMRIADYSILDSYEELVVESMKVIEGKVDVGSILKLRHERILRDEKRYWRFKDLEGNEWTFLYYVDNLRLLIRLGLSPKELSLNQAAGLAIVPVINLTKAIRST